MSAEGAVGSLVLNTPVQRQCDLLIGEDTRTVRLRIRSSTPGLEDGRLVIGDRIDISEIDPAGEADLLRVHERKTRLIRRRPGDRDEPVVMCANIDRMLCIVSSADPQPAWGMLDRCLVIGEAEHIPPTVVLTKRDLDPRGDACEHARLYERIGYPVLSVSVITCEGIDALAEHIAGSISVMLGQSGVGKSALATALSGVEQQVGEISRKSGKGQHTTTRARLVPLACGGFLADPPGIRSLIAWGIDDDRLPYLFPEIRQRIDDCRFVERCTHMHEPDCAVTEAVERGEIHPRRYQSYLRMRLKSERGAGPTARFMDDEDDQ